MVVAQSSSGKFMIRRIACHREGGDGSAERRQSVIYNCLVLCCSFTLKPRMFPPMAVWCLQRIIAVLENVKAKTK